MNVTLTGVDSRTDLSALPDDCEIGVLYTETPEGRNRYPSKMELLNILAELRLRRRRVALHVCGSGARRELLASNIAILVSSVQRIQVNGRLTPEELESICEDYPRHEIITQHTQANSCLLDVRAKNHSILVDGSGGRGISPKFWERPHTDKRCGHAGGLGPDNISVEYPKIESVAVGHWWVDMEGKLRVDDWFSVERANAVADQLRGVAQ